MITRFILGTLQLSFQSVSVNSTSRLARLTQKFGKLVIPRRNISSHMDSSDHCDQLECDNNLRLRGYQLCKDHIGGIWSAVSPQEINIVALSGGMTNALFICSLPETTPFKNGQPTQVLLRFYGDQWRDCDMSVQLGIFTLLSSKNLGPKLYGSFDHGRIEEYLPANPLTSDEMRNKQISSVISKKLAMIHSLDVPIEKNNRWIYERYEEFIEVLEKSPDLDSYLSQDHLSPKSKEIAKHLRSINYRTETEFVRDMLDKTTSEIVFSHNDLHQGNILLAKVSKRRPTLDERVFFIDFEYCSYNYRSYDIANHFCEWCFDYDTPEYPHFEYRPDKFPSEEEQRSFARIYLSEREKLESKPVFISREGSTIVSPRSENTSNGHTHVNGYSNLANLVSQQEDALLEEIKPLMMAANLLWTIWCVKCAYNSKIKFGFWEHAAARWESYSDMKSNYIKSHNCKTNGTKR